VDLIAHIQSVTLESFIAQHPRITRIKAEDPLPPLQLRDPLTALSAESTYNKHAFDYVCQVAGQIAESSPYVFRHLVSSQVLAAASIEEGGMPARDFLDPHASLRLWMIECAEKWAGRPAPVLQFAEEACKRMGDVYLWRSQDLPNVGDRFAAMLGAHFASEYLAAQQEFPAMVCLFNEQQPDLLAYLGAQKEPHFGFSAADWLEGHPAVETKHAGYGARAAETAVWGLEGKAMDDFWESF
jgi:hypothetical protein